MRILGISGSLRRDSHNSALLRAAADLLPPGVELRVCDGLGEVPAFNEDLLPVRPEPAQRFWDAADAADGILVVTPEYNHSVPGHLKNSLDWLSRPLAASPLKRKPAAVAGASTGIFGAVWSQAETRKVLAAIGARVIDTELPVPGADERFDAAGRLIDAEIESGLAALIEELAEAVGERAGAGAP